MIKKRGLFVSRGINVAESFIFKRAFSNINATRKPVVFLSHKSEDKDFVEDIGEYFLNAGINIYLDKNDFNLQTAVKAKSPKEITSCIQRGISECDYILCFVSKETAKSWWVPYEIGYGKKAEKEIATLIRKDVEYIPEYLKIEETLENIVGINNFIKKITAQFEIPVMEKYGYEYTSKDYIEKSSSSHSLSKYLKVT